VQNKEAARPASLINQAFYYFCTVKPPEMLEQFEKFRQSKNIFNSSDKILLAVSGGIDSVVMLDLFTRMDYKIAVAHCNFQLRGEESDGDQAFVADLCRQAGLRLYTKKFETASYASEKGISIQMAARDLRFEWLAGLRKEEDYDLIATGHNLNDSVETILINLTRGTGINGLTGIDPVSGHIIRPLLFATRQMIMHYADENSISYREDSSNIQTRYTRNKIRHNVIPVLEQINPSVLYSISETAEFLKSAYHIYRSTIEEKRKEIVEYDEKSSCIRISELRKLHPLETWVYELFRDYHFGRQQVSDIIRLLDAETGKQIISYDHILTRDRERIIISPSDTAEFTAMTISSVSGLRDLSLFEKAEIIDVDELQISDDPSFAYLDAAMIDFPLSIRKWQKGDFFHPLGMKGSKKVSDFLIDTKTPLPEKDRILVLTMNDKIIWLIGRRIDNRYKVSDSTSRVLMIKLRNN
jgi:tRNA(Ile)-lysidine synthase